MYKYLKEKIGGVPLVNYFACIYYYIVEMFTNDWNFSYFLNQADNVDPENPLYKYVMEQNFAENDIKWNFEKFLIDKNGQVVKRYGPMTEPNVMLEDIKKLF